MKEWWKKINDTDRKRINMNKSKKETKYENIRKCGSLDKYFGEDGDVMQRKKEV